ncbi:MAG TPA: MarR family winged helix-turn-helix transcriptional regulator [Deinococcales bacterium]|nr:MarR family winged helix-turn-helix transcriptional regulator [Deinococcales bacterium]
MSATLRDEIKQRQPFRSLEEEASLNLARTFVAIMDAGERLYASHGITGAQYNVLRILRGAGHSGLGRNDIRDRLVGRMPDVTRLVDRMEEAGLVRRERSSEDRRCVPTFLTERGRDLVNRLDEPVAELHHRHFGHLSTGQLHTLIETLTQVRGHVEPE